MRKCRCGCGNSIEHKHPNAKFLNKKHKDRYHNLNNPRGYFSHCDDLYNTFEEDHPFSSEALGQE